MRQLLQQDQAFERILVRLHAAKERNNLVTAPNKTTFHPESKVVSVWEMSLACVLLWTCIIVPLKLGWDHCEQTRPFSALDHGTLDHCSTRARA